MAKGPKRYNKKRFYKKKGKRYNKNRDYKNPIYVKWRNEVKQRDGHRCQWPGCLSTNNLQVHHIKTWAKNPGMRFAIANGITLCRNCHKSVHGKEHDYEGFFFKILEWQMLDKIKKYNKRKKK